VTLKMVVEPRFAVVIPAYRAEAFILKTIKAVAAQTLPPAEVIVVDDGSTDGTCTVVEAFAREKPLFPIKLVRESHRGPGASRNTGIYAAEAEWIAFLDADDLWHPEKLGVVSRTIGAHPEANFFCHNELLLELDGSESVSDYGAGFFPGRSLAAQLFERNRFSTSAVVCRRSLLLEAGGFDESLTSAQDYELWLRLAPNVVPMFIPEVLGTYVMRSGNISTSSYWRRLLNLLRVRHRHRRQANRSAYLRVQCLAVASHVLPPNTRSMIKRAIGRRSA
jgi:glycosyltransferase involved in cell wall biosynthesis